MSRASPRFRRLNPVAAPMAYNVWRLAVVGSLEGQMTVSNFYYHDSTAITSGVNVTRQNNFYNAWVAATGPWEEYKLAVSSDWTSVEIRVDSPTSPDFGTAIYPQGAPGLGPAAHQPTHTAAILAKQTTLKGQCGRGHVAMPAVPAGWIVASHITNTTAYTNLCAALMVALTSGADTWTPVVFSRGTRLNRQVGYTEITAITLRTLLGTVRRRKIGRGK